MLEGIQAMDTERMAEIIADPAIMAELRKCTSVTELVARLNQAGADCTREEGLRFLRAWEHIESDGQETEVEKKECARSGTGLLHRIRSVIREPSRRRMAAPKQTPRMQNMELILKHMNR